MSKADQRALAEIFRRAHRGPPLLLLPNAWDAMSARQFEAAGFGAIATTSGGVAWSLGFPDGMPKGLVERLAAENIHVAPRIGRMRISPHVYNDERDVDRFVEVFHRLMP